MSGEFIKYEEDETNEKHKKNRISIDDVTWRDFKYQMLVGNITFLPTLQVGIGLSFSNLLLNDLNEEMGSWFASIFNLSVPIGCIISGPLSDKIGRKKTNLITTLFITFTWFLISVSTTDQIMLFLFFRILSGISTGLTTAFLIYVSEISYKKYRPVLLSSLSIYVSVGILFTSILHSIFTWRQAAVCLIFTFLLISVIIYFLTPESPVWLVNFPSDWNTARKNLKKLYPNEKLFEIEWNYLKENRLLTTANPKVKTNYNLTKPSSYKPLITLILLYLLQQLSGSYATIFYALKIFSTISPYGEKISQKEAFIIIGILRLIGSFLCSYFSSKIDRKLILLISSFTMFICCALLFFSTDDYIQSYIHNENISKWTAVISFFLFIFWCSFGVTTIPWTLPVELLPKEIKNIGNSFLTSYAYLLLFITIKIFPFVMNAMAIEHLFLVFGFNAICLIFLVYYFVPETFGKTFREIEVYFTNKKQFYPIVKNSNIINI